MFLFSALFSVGNPPSRIIIAFVTTDSYSGNYGKNPFRLHRHIGDEVAKRSTLIECQIELNGQTIDGLMNENPEFQYLRNFLFFDNLTTGSTTSVSYEEFLDGYFFCSFDFTTGLCASASSIIPTIRSGACRLSLKWDKPLPEEVSILVYSEFYSLLQINQSRQVKINYY